MISTPSSVRRARWVAGSYKHPPVVRAVLPNAAGVRQGRLIEGRVFEARCDPPGMSAIVFPCLEGEPEPFDRIEAKKEGEDWRLLTADRAPAGLHRPDRNTRRRRPLIAAAPS